MGIACECGIDSPLYINHAVQSRHYWRLILNVVLNLLGKKTKLLSLRIAEELLNWY